MTIRNTTYDPYGQNDPALWWTDVQLGGRTLLATLVWAVVIPLSGLIVFTLMLSVNLVASKVFGYNELSGVTPHAVVACPEPYGLEVTTTDMQLALSDQKGSLCPSGEYRYAAYYYGHEPRNFDNFRDGNYPEGGVVTTANDGVLFWIPFIPFMLTWVIAGLVFMFHPQILRWLTNRLRPETRPRW